MSPRHVSSMRMQHLLYLYTTRIYVLFAQSAEGLHFTDSVLSFHLETFFFFVPFYCHHYVYSSLFISKMLFHSQCRDTAAALVKSDNWKELMNCRVNISKVVFINPLMMLIKEMPGIY